MLRESQQWWLLNAAIRGERPRIMTPEETKEYESWCDEIRKDREEGIRCTYDIPTSYPESGIDFYPKDLPEEKSKIILAAEELMEKYYETYQLHYEDGGAELLPAVQHEIIEFSRYASDRIWLPTDAGIPEYLRYAAYTFTAGLIDNYDGNSDRAFPLAEDLISRTMELVILKRFAENWDDVSKQIPGAKDDDRCRLTEIIARLEEGKSALRVREIGTVNYAGQKKLPISRLIRSAGKKTAGERQKAAARLAALFRKEDLEPMIRIRAYCTKDRKLMTDWLLKNYPESMLLRELIRTVGETHSREGQD